MGIYMFAIARSVRRFSKRLDFRSDTVTKPCQKMKKAIE